MARLPSVLPAHLASERDTIREIALEYGLDFFEVLFEMVDFEQMNELAAYLGFPTRYPHWRWGMEYERLRKSYAYGLHKIYELVINNDPCYAYLLTSNELVDQKLVMAHVYGHSDFFKNNLWFSRTNRKMLDEMANHASRVWRIIDRIGMEEVEEFIDVCLSLENLLDRYAPYSGKRPNAVDDEQVEIEVRRPGVSKLRVEREYMDTFINPPDLLRSEAEERAQALRERTSRFPREPENDVLLFLLEHAPLESWQQEVLSIIREEAYYFAPQGMTKILNEGWACVVAGSLVSTDRGLMGIEDIVEQRLPVRVQDGQGVQPVYDWAKFEERETVRIRTRRGLELEGSLTHRIQRADGSWQALGDIREGERLHIAGGANQWAAEYVTLDWRPAHRITLQDVAAQAEVDIETVIRYRQGVRGRHSARLAAPVAEYDADLGTLSFMQNRRFVPRIPIVLDEELAAFLGYLIGDGHISEKKRVIGLTTGDEEQADRFAQLVESLFGVQPRKRLDGARWRVNLHAKNIEDFLKYLGMRTGRAAKLKEVPPSILCSPKSVVSAFLRAYFDCDGYAGKQGVILTTASGMLGKTAQLLLLNFGILSSRRLHQDGCWHIHIMGRAAKVFQQEIGFGLLRKQEALRQYLDAHRWFKRQEWDDEVVVVERRRAAVYDISVEGTHRYVAQGFINHNSYWHTTIMTRSGVMTDAEVVDYADHHSGTVAMSPQRINPYKIGLELLRDIEDRWNRGRFGKEWDECDDARARREWDLKLGLGREKVFEVRRIYNDVGFIDTFFTEDFCNRHQLFTYHYNERSGRYEIDSREFQMVKQKLLFSLTNFGQPDIMVRDANHENRGALLLKHDYRGVELKLDEARDTLKNIFTLWKRPVYLETTIDDTLRLLSFDGKEHITRRVR